MIQAAPLAKSLREHCLASVYKAPADFVSRLLGHANPTVTFSTYAHLFEQADHAVAAREALEASYEAMTSASGQ